MAPTATSLDRSAVALSSATTSVLTGRYIVTLKGRGVANLAEAAAALGGSVEWISAGAGLATVSGLDATGAAALARSSAVAAVDADEAFPLDDPSVESVLEAADPSPASQAAPATAFFFPRQWNMRAVQADVAWAGGSLGSPSVSVFILDSGIDYLHADLAGLVDQSRSVDMLGTFTVGGVPFTESDTVAKYFPTRQAFTDLFFHGTHVAATVSSNALAAAGVTSRTTLVAVKVCAYLNTCPFSSILGGVAYAADNGADVINMSLGGSFAKAGNGRFVGLINMMFNYARAKGVTIVVSAGNSAIDLDHDGNGYNTYCSTPATVCVAATGPTFRGSVNGPFQKYRRPGLLHQFRSFGDQRRRARWQQRCAGSAPGQWRQLRLRRVLRYQPPRPDLRDGHVRDRLTGHQHGITPRGRYCGAPGAAAGAEPGSHPRPIAAVGR